MLDARLFLQSCIPVHKLKHIILNNFIRIYQQFPKYWYVIITRIIIIFPTHLCLLSLLSWRRSSGLEGCQSVPSWNPLVELFSEISIYGHENGSSCSLIFFESKVLVQRPFYSILKVYLCFTLSLNCPWTCSANFLTNEEIDDLALPIPS